MSASLALKHLRYELDAGFIDYDRDRFPDKTVRQKKRIALTKRIDMASALLDSIADPSTLTPPFKRRLRQMRRKLFGKQRSYEGENAFRVARKKSEQFAKRYRENRELRLETAICFLIGQLAVFWLDLLFCG